MPSPAGFPEIAFKLSGVATEIPPQTSCADRILDEKKINSLSKDLSSIMKFIEKLNELNTDKTNPLTSIINASLKTREDKVKVGEIRDQILKNSPDNNEEFFVVPKVVE